VTVLEKRIRWSGLLVAAGIGVLVVSLYWDHPLAFMAFLGIGCPLVGVGILLYLYALSASKVADEP